MEDQRTTLALELQSQKLFPAALLLPHTAFSGALSDS